MAILIDNTTNAICLGSTGAQSALHSKQAIASSAQTIATAEEVALKAPLVVRLEGANVDQGKAIINNSGLNVIAANDLSDAAEKVVKAVREAG